MSNDIMHDYSNAAPTQQEIETLTCAWCGKKAKSEAGLKTHKTAESRKYGYSKMEKKMAMKQQVALTMPPKQEDKLNCLDLGIKEIVVGSRIGLKGQHYIVDSANNLHFEFADDVIVLVEQRWRDKNTNKFYLRARAVGGEKEWVCTEEEVLLNKNAYLIALTTPKIPENYVPEIPAMEPEAEQNDQEDLKQKQAYLEALQAYVDARNIKLVAQKKFDQVRDQYESVLRDYVTQNGVDLDSGKRLSLEGYTVTLQSSKEVSYNEDQIIEYLKERNLVFALKPVVDFEAWATLKNEGKVASEFVEQVEVVKPTKSKLLLEKDVDES